MNIGPTIAGGRMPKKEKGRRGDPSMKSGPFNEPGTVLKTVRQEDEVQAKGCLSKTTFPLPVMQTEISLDIGSPTFHYVDDD